MTGELVYLVYPDAETVERLSSYLQGAGFKVISLRSDAEAETALNDFRYVLPDVLMTPLDDPDSGDSILFRLLSVNPLMEQVPVVILASGDSGERRQALRMGLTNLVFPPYEPEELILSTRLAIDRHRDENRLFGSLSQLSVPELFQTVEVGRRSGVVVLKHGRRSGTVWFRDGNIVRSEVDEESGDLQALYEMIGWEEGTFEADFTHYPPPGDFELAPAALLLEAMRLQDEARRDREEAATGGKYDTVKLQPLVEEPSPPADVPEAPSAGIVEDRDRVALPERGDEIRGAGHSAEDALAVHSALMFLNLFVAYAMSRVAPSLLRQRMEALRQRLEMENPELRIFELSPECHVVLNPETTMMLDRRAVLSAVTLWLLETASALERAMPGRFSPRRIAELVAPARGGEVDPEMLESFRDLGAVS